jgi:hypothetical protein
MSDPCIYTFRNGDMFAVIALYVDDIPVACNDVAWTQAFKATLGARFKIKDVGDLSQLLGMHITRDMSARTISMDQSKYVKVIMVKHHTDFKSRPYRWSPASSHASRTWTPHSPHEWPKTSIRASLAAYSTVQCARAHTSLMR